MARRSTAAEAGAAGMGASGNRLAELFSFGQSSALDFEKQRYNELSNLAGVNAGSPVAAAGLQLGFEQPDVGFDVVDDQDAGGHDPP